jgi:hypothetical protein
MSKDFFYEIFEEDSVDYIFNNVQPYVLAKSNKIRINQGTSDLPCGFQDVTEKGKNGSIDREYLCSTFKVFSKRVKVESRYNVNGVTKEEALAKLKIKTLRVLIRKLSEESRKEKISSTATNTASKNCIHRVVDEHYGVKKSTLYHQKQKKRAVIMLVAILRGRKMIVNENSLNQYKNAKEAIMHITSLDIDTYWLTLSHQSTKTLSEKYNALQRFYEQFDSSFYLPLPAALQHDKVVG